MSDSASDCAYTKLTHWQLIHMPAAVPDGSTTQARPASGPLDEFRNLSQLLTLVTAVNSPLNHPTLHMERELNRDHEFSLDSDEDTVMHAVTTILVREHEILACMFEKPSAENGDAAVLVAQDDRTSKWEEDDYEYGVVYRVDTQQLNVVTVGNPDQTVDEESAAPNCCLQVDPGTNYWPTMSQSGPGEEWRFLFE